MEKIIDRFLRYIAVDTASDPESSSQPSTNKQFVLLEMLRKGELTAGHARAILSIKQPKRQEEAAQKIAALDLSVRQAELLCKNMTVTPKPAKEPTLEVNYVAECEKTLSKQLGRGVKIVNGKRKGRFELEFYGQEDLQVLLDALMKLQK